MRAWLNGRLVDAASPALTVTEPGFTLGDGVFTTTVVEGGVPFALGRNLARLTRHALKIGLPEPDPERLARGVRELLDADGVRDARLRLSLTPETVVITTGPAASYSSTSVALTVPWRRNERGALAGVKSLSFGEVALAWRWFRPQGADEGLVLNTAGDVCEGVTSNVFAVVGGRLRTPPLASGCLDGVTREILCELLDVDEAPITVAEVAASEEVFWTSATRKVQPIGRLDGRPLDVHGSMTDEAGRALGEWSSA